MKSLSKVALITGCVLGAAVPLLAQEQLRWVPSGVVEHRTITAIDGLILPLATNSNWSVNPKGAKTVRFFTDIAVKGTTALTDDPILTLRPYIRGSGLVVGAATSVSYTRPRLEDTGVIKCQKTVNAGVAYTDYSSEVIDNSAGTVAGFNSWDTIANGDWVIIGSSSGPIMGAAWNITTMNSNASVLLAQYWDGDSWETLADLTDGTITAAKTFGVDGQMTWTVPIDWASSEINSITAYWARLTVDTVLDADTTAEELDLLLPIQVSIDAEVLGDDVMLLLESLSSVTGTPAYSGTVWISWR